MISGESHGSAVRNLFCYEVSRPLVGSHARKPGIGVGLVTVDQFPHGFVRDARLAGKNGNRTGRSKC